MHGVVTRAAGWLAAVGCGEPEVAVRGGALFGRRLARPAGALVPPAAARGVPWRLEAGGGTLDGLALVPCPEAAAPLAAGAGPGRGPRGRAELPRCR